MFAEMKHIVCFKTFICVQSGQKVYTPTSNYLLLTEKTKTVKWNL